MVAYGCEGLGYIITGSFLVTMATKMPTLNGFSAYCWVAVGLAALPSYIVWAYLAHRWVTFLHLWRLTFCKRLVCCYR
ncbi:YbfB/YjiJ family MFS transporter [Alicyclobacillus fastidiosus]|uniref:YbfB/YjiJ family MFS transporter n=1 Tax=Alicyclobacillus fastidiosus TaxID=392011 RepID=UPI003D67CEF3